MSLLAVIGGSGLADLSGLEIEAEEMLSTPFGECSSSIQRGLYGGNPVLFLARHGRPHVLAPHQINYRANIWALRQFGATEILAVNAVGGINSGLRCGTILLPDQIIDYSWGREHSFFLDCSADHPVHHVDFSDPYDAALRQKLLQAAQQAKVAVEDGGVYACSQGPRLETAAEIDKLERDGCDIVGMTGMPEAALARELEIPYACLSLVVNMAAGRSEEQITMEAIEAVMAEGVVSIKAVLAKLLEHRAVLK